MKHSVPHDLSREQAKQAASAALASYSERFADYRPRVTWTSENRAEVAFSVKGLSLAGSIEVLERAIEMDLEVPFLLRPFKNKALSVIERHIQKWVDKARAGKIS